MATKKTKKTTRRRSAARKPAGEPQTGVDETDTSEALDSVAESTAADTSSNIDKTGDQPKQPAAGRRRRRKPARAAADTGAPGTGASKRAAEPADDEPVKVERVDSGVVIRFPPVAVPTRPAAAPSARPPAAKEEPPRAAAPARDDSYEPPPAPPADFAAADLDDDDSGDDPLERAAEMFDDEGEPVVEIDREDEPIDLDDEFAAESQTAERPPREQPAEGEEEGKRRRGRRRRRGGRRRRGRQNESTAAPPAEPAGAEESDESDESDEPAELMFDRLSPLDLAADTDDDDVIEVAREARAEEAEEPAGEEPAQRGRGRGRRRRPRRRDRDDVAGYTDSEKVAGVSEPEEEISSVDDTQEEGEARAIQRDLSKSVRKEMIINIVPREECRIAIVENGKLEEIYLERASAENHVGNIYKGVVTNVEPSIQAAFIDFGLGKNGFLHISDLHPQYFPNGEKQTENVGRKLPRRSRPPIQRCLRRNQEILVQITKEGIGTKGPTLSTYLSIPGRFLVMMPGMRRLGVSRRIEDDEMRDKLRAAMSELELPQDMGFIARTAALNRTKRELQSDLNYLTRLWRAVQNRIRHERAPAELYRESDLVIRTIRDVFTSDIERIVVDDREVADRAREFLSIFSPRSRDAVIEYHGDEPIFHRHGIEAELERLHSRHVPLRSGGSLVIDQTEALVAIDVNSGRFRAEDDAETTAYKINCEAAEEIPRQLRLRDLGGVIICDFIDMRSESHRREIERRLIRNLKQHKERAKVLRMSAFGIIEMTRQRQRASLTRSVYQDCHHCRGTGLVKTAESVALDVMRLLQLTATRQHIASIEVTVSPEVANLLLNRKRSLLHQLESKNRRNISIKPEAHFGLDQVQIQCFDQRGRLVPHS